MLNANLSKMQRSLVLFLESSVVDYGGLFDTRRVNEEEMAEIEKLVAQGLMTYDRLHSDSIIKNSTNWFTHAITIGEILMSVAQNERRERAKRMYEKRTWKTTKEVRETA